MRRRKYLKTLVAGGASLTVAGCVGGDDDSGDDGSDDSGSDDGGSSDDGGGNGDDSSGEDNPYGLSDGVVTIGSDIPYKPFEYRTESGDLTGFDPGIAEAVFAEEMGLDYEFQKTAFDGIIASLNNGNFRVVMSAMTINDTRDERVDFSDPYFTAYQTVIVLESDDIESREDLKGISVGVQKGTTGEGAAEQLKEEFGGDLEIQSYDQITGAFNALVNNQVRAVVNDNTVNGQFASENDGVVFLEGEGAAAESDQDAPDYLTLTVENYGIAFREDDDEFTEAVNEALAAVKESGAYDEIYDEYFAG